MDKKLTTRVVAMSCGRHVFREQKGIHLAQKDVMALDRPFAPVSDTPPRG